MRRITALLLAPALTTLAVAQTVHVVDVAGGGDFTSVQAAVNAANSGDTVLVKMGSYGRTVIDGKGLTVAAEMGQNVTIQGGLSVRNLPADDVVALLRLRLQGNHGAGTNSEHGLDVDGCSGPVRVDDCVIRGDHGGFFSGNNDHGGTGVQVRACADIAFVRCAVQGGNSGVTWACSDGWDNRAGHGLVAAQDSLVTLHDCSVVAGDAYDRFDIECGGQQAHGGWVADSRLYGSGTRMEGGRGGSELLCALSFPGGDGLRLEGGNAHADLQDMTLVGGPSNACGSAPGKPLHLLGGATANFLPGTPHALEVGSPLRVGTKALLQLSGSPGERALVAISPGAAWVDRIPWQAGPWLGRGPTHVAFLGTIPGSGVLTRTINVPPIGGGFDSQTHFLQGIFASNGTSWLGSHAVMVVLDPQF